MNDSPAVRYAIVGSGWRSQFFLRLAATLPDRFAVTGVATRTAQRGAEVTARWSVPSVRTIDELLTADPDFVIVSVPWEQTPAAVRSLVARDVAVLAETPPAPDTDGLRALWADVGRSGLVQVAEQYLLLPGHAARLHLIRDGVIGQATSAQVSSTHLYHAVSMIRGYVGAGFAPAVVSAQAFTAPLADPLGKDGWSGEVTARDVTTTLATVDFGGAMGLYDFTDNQWWNPLRTRRIVVRGSTGELVDDQVVRLVDPTTPVTSYLVRRQLGVDLNLEGHDLDTISFDGQVVYRNPFRGARLADEDIAIATLLDGMRAWLHDDGPPPYPLAEACHDHLISLAITESAQTGRSVKTGAAPWAA
jgi:predicted dehydrogenase